MDEIGGATFAAADGVESLVVPGSLGASAADPAPTIDSMQANDAKIKCLRIANPFWNKLMNSVVEVLSLCNQSLCLVQDSAILLLGADRLD
jgi:hypothetical protein